MVLNTACVELRHRYIPLPDSHNLRDYREDEHMRQALDPACKNCIYIECDVCNKYSACCKGWARDSSGDLRCVIAQCAACHGWNPQLPPTDSDESTPNDSDEEAFCD